MTKAAAAAKIAEQAIANAEPVKEVPAAGTTAIPGEGVSDSGPDSFAVEDAALQASSQRSPRQARWHRRRQ